MYTVEQIREAGTKGEINHHDVEHIISTLELLYGSDSSQNSGKPIVSGSLPLDEDDIWDDVQAMIEYTYDVEAIIQELKRHFVVSRQ